MVALAKGRTKQRTSMVCSGGIGRRREGRSRGHRWGDSNNVALGSKGKELGTGHRRHAHGEDDAEDNDEDGEVVDSKRLMVVGDEQGENGEEESGGVDGLVEGR